MKNVFLYSIIAYTAFVTSCSPKLYQQIATLSSDNVQMQNNGKFLYSANDISIEYDFWSESGYCLFKISNNTDNNIYIDLKKSYFINNGNAYDYYQARTFVFNSKYALTSNTGNTSTFFRNTYINLTSNKTEKEFSVEYAEQDIICIPSHSTKQFCEFNISDTLHYEPDLIMKPYSKEKTIKRYNKSK